MFSYVQLYEFTVYREKKFRNAWRTFLYLCVSGKKGETIQSHSFL